MVLPASSELALVLLPLSFNYLIYVSRFCWLAPIYYIIWACCSSLCSLIYCSSLSLCKSCSTSVCWSGFIPFITVFALFMSITSIIWELLPSSICLFTSPNRACSFSGVALLLSLGGLLVLSGEYLPDLLFYSAAAIYSLHLSLYFYLSSLS